MIGWVTLYSKRILVLLLLSSTPLIDSNNIIRTIVAWTTPIKTYTNTIRSSYRSTPYTYRFINTISTGKRSSVFDHNMVVESNTNQNVLDVTGTTLSSTTTTTTTIEYVKKLPNLPLPPPICSNIPGTWAYDTMSRRVCQEIVCNIVLKDCYNDLCQISFLPIRDAIITLRTELQFASTTPLTPILVPSFDDTDTTLTKQEQDDIIQECKEWNMMLKPYIQNCDTWLSAPWMITEFYMYRRLIQCLDYWNPKSVGYMYDPFITQKRNGLYTSIVNAEPAFVKLQNLIQQVKDSSSSSTLDTTIVSTGLNFAIQLSLWGNKMDLSLWPVDMDNQDSINTDVFTSILEQASTNLLHDDSPIINQYCIETLRNQQQNDNNESKSNNEKQSIYIDIVVDNAGFELVTDLALAQYLIESNIATNITFHMKSHPTFVSDALNKDLYETIEYYSNLDKTIYPACYNAGQIWKQYISNGQWICIEHRFWVQPLPMWDMYPTLYNEIQSRCDLIFIKGDANYRRLLGDLHWDISNASFHDVVGCYFPTAICALRTLKAEIGCGIDHKQVERAKSLDPNNWMTNGRFGVIQYGVGTKNKNKL